MALQKLFCISTFLLVCTSKAINPEAEALLRWKSSLIRANSLSSWSIFSSTCSWYGVSCDAAGHLTKLQLSSVDLHGTLHAFYSAAFENLSVLDLHNNHLVGIIPANISLFLTLNVLDLSYNNLVGDIPYQLSKLPVIAELDLGNNHLTSPDYAKFSPMFTLKLLSLDNNDLTGTFPQFIVNCTNVSIRSLDLSGNAFSGPLPASLPEMVPRLRYLNLSSNGFSGLIPRSLSRLQKLEILLLNKNNLVGGIPEELGIISGLRMLHLGSNSLGGSIPSSLGQLQLLETLGIRNASIVSTLPPELGNLTSIRNMYLSDNRLFGSFPPSFARMQELRHFGIKENSISGTIPQEMFINWTKVVVFDVGDNLLTGSAHHKSAIVRS